MNGDRRPLPGPPGTLRAVEVVQIAELVPVLSDDDWVAAAFTPEELASVGRGTTRAGGPAARAAEALSARVAAKRAVLSTLARAGRRGSGEREPEVLRSVELLRGPDGRPTARVAAAPGQWEVAVSLSHDGGLAGALAVVGGNGPGGGEPGRGGPGGDDPGGREPRGDR